MRVRFYNPVLYLAVYLISILLFAFMYNSMDGQFYAPYARFEAPGMDDGYRVGRIFQQSIYAAMSKSNEELVTSGKFSFEKSISFISLFSDNGAGQFTFNLTIGLKAPKGLFQFSAKGIVDHEKIVMGETGKSPLISRFMSLDVTGPIEKYLNEATVDKTEIESRLGKLDFSEDDEDEIERYLAGLSGDPTSLSGSFYRMLYFSAVVITTVGFGDIVPMTGTARLMVAVEALWGIVILGLFIDAVAKQNRI